MVELTPFLNKKLGIPLYVQLYQYIKKGIVTGEIPSEASLPSIRYLSQYLKISKNTVENAYQQLIAEGYVESKPRSGLTVLHLEGHFLQRTEHDVKPITDIEKKTTIYPYDFTYGDVDVTHFPFKMWGRCLQDAMQDSNVELSMNGQQLGDMDLCLEIATYLFQARGVSCVPEQIVICAGTQQAISFICQLLSLHGQSVAIENPGYVGVRTVFMNHACNILPISLESDGIDISQLSESDAKVVYITPSHQFPYGMILPIQKRLKLLEWAYENESYIIEDDYDSEFRYQGQPIPSLKALDTRENVIYLGTFSKSFLPAVRLNYLVLPPQLIDKFQKQFQHYTQSSSPIMQRAMYLFMKHGYFERHIRKMRKVYQSKHKVLIDAIETYLGYRVEIIGHKAGLHILLKIKECKIDLIEKAKEFGVKVYSTSKYWSEQSDDGLVMLGFGGMTEEKIEEGIRLLGKAWFG